MSLGYSHFPHTQAWNTGQIRGGASSASLCRAGHLSLRPKAAQLRLKPKRALSPTAVPTIAKRVTRGASTLSASGSAVSASSTVAASDTRVSESTATYTATATPTTTASITPTSATHRPRKDRRPPTLRDRTAKSRQPLHLPPKAPGLASLPTPTPASATSTTATRRSAHLNAPPDHAAPTLHPPKRRKPPMGLGGPETATLSPLPTPFSSEAAFANSIASSQASTATGTGSVRDAGDGGVPAQNKGGAPETTAGLRRSTRVPGGAVVPPSLVDLPDEPLAASSYWREHEPEYRQTPTREAPPPASLAEAGQRETPEAKPYQSTAPPQSAETELAEAGQEVTSKPKPLRPITPSQFQQFEYADQGRAARSIHALPVGASVIAQNAPSAPSGSPSLTQQVNIPPPSSAAPCPTPPLPSAPQSSGPSQRSLLSSVACDSPISSHFQTTAPSLAVSSVRESALRLEGSAAPAGPTAAGAPAGSADANEGHGLRPTPDESIHRIPVPSPTAAAAPIQSADATEGQDLDHTPDNSDHTPVHSPTAAALALPDIDHGAEWNAILVSRLPEAKDMGTQTDPPAKDTGAQTDPPKDRTTHTSPCPSTTAQRGRARTSRH